jgi:hypothetical protein
VELGLLVSLLFFSFPSAVLRVMPLLADSPTAAAATAADVDADAIAEADADARCGGGGGSSRWTPLCGRSLLRRRRRRLRGVRVHACMHACVLLLRLLHVVADAAAGGGSVGHRCVLCCGAFCPRSERSDRAFFFLALDPHMGHGPVQSQ